MKPGNFPILTFFRPIVSLAFLFGFAACDSKMGKEGSGPEAQIEAEIQNLPKDSPILLSRIGPKGPEALDSAKSDEKGRFSLSAPADVDRLYILSIGNQRLPVFLEEGKHELKADFNQLTASAKYSNSPLTELMGRIEGLRIGFDLKAKNLQFDFQEAMMNGKKARADSAENAFYELQKSSKTTVKHLIDSIGPSPVSHLATSMLSVDEDFGYLDSLAQRFTKEKPNAAFTQKINQFMENPRKTGLGKPAPDFTQADPNGNSLALSKFRGKVVLIDFWASWCKPCRAENPSVVAAYKKFKSKGLEIVGVSLDSEKEAWMKAIVKDGLFWPQVSDLKGWENSAAQLYGINSIPASFLLDKEGKIIGKNLRGEALEQKLSEILH